MSLMSPCTFLDVCRDIRNGWSSIGPLLIRNGQEAVNKAGRDGYIIIAPEVTLTKWGERLLRDADLDAGV